MRGNTIWFSIILGLVLPWVILMRTEKEIISDIHPETTASTEVVQPKYLDVLLPDNSVNQMELEDYVLGVLLGEIPADFEDAALCAQAVVARTFAVKSMRAGYKHINSDVCTNSSCCQSYYDPYAYLQDGGRTETVKRFKDAVSSTTGQVLVYDGSLIEATYFACSGGKTEDAQAVWGSEIPYLKSVESPGEEQSDYYTDTVSFSVNEFRNRIDTSLTGLPGTWIGKITYTQGGGVDTIQLGDSIYTGTQVRQKLGLRSTAFAICVIGDRVTVTTKGFGHRVGMSQYGADAMAVRGCRYTEILAYYYPGTVITDHNEV